MTRILTHTIEVLVPDDHEEGFEAEFEDGLIYLLETAELIEGHERVTINYDFDEQHIEDDEQVPEENA